MSMPACISWLAAHLNKEQHLTPGAIMPVFKSAAIFTKDSASLRPPLAALAQTIERSGVEVLLDPDSARILGSAAQYATGDRKDIVSRADVAIVLGGDGTTLSVGRLLAETGKPLIGINAGRLGFITDVVLEEMQRVIPIMMEGHFVRDERPVISGCVIHEGKTVFSALAVNDAGITHGKVGGMVEFTIYVDGQRMATQRADSIIYASSTGSTAYALAAGGPILHPRLHGAVLVPVAPHTLTNRPIVLPADSTVEIELVDVKNGQAYFDMQEFMPMASGDILQLSAGKAGFTLLHPPGYNHYDLLRRKLQWNLTPSSGRFLQAGDNR